MLNAQLDPAYVELFLKLRANPRLRIRGAVENTSVFLIDMDRLLMKVSPATRQYMLLCAQGLNQTQIAARMNVCKRTTGRWHRKIQLTNESGQAIKSKTR